MAPHAAAALERIGPPAVGPLAAALRGDDSWERPSAADTLGRIGGASAIDALVSSLDNPAVRENVIHALRDIGAPSADALLTALGHEDPAVRTGAVAALALLGDSRAVDPVIGVLGDPEPGVRARAAHALERLGDARVLDPLAATVADQDAGVQREATEALLRIVEPLVEDGDPRAVEPLIAAVGRMDRDGRTAACEALGKLGDPRAVEPLVALLEDDEPEVQVNAAVALGRIGDARAVDALIATLPEGARPVSVSAAAARALGTIGDARAVEPLIAAVDERCAPLLVVDNELGPARGRRTSVIEAAAAALAVIGDSRAVAYLIGALESKTAFVGTRAATSLTQVLRRSPQDVDVDLLRRAVALDDTCEIQVYEAVCAFGPQYSTADCSQVRQLARQELIRREVDVSDARTIQPLAAALRRPDAEGRRRAVQALERIGDARAADVLVTALGNREPQVRGLAAGALGRIRARGAVEPLVAGLRDDDPEVRGSCAGALGAIRDPCSVEPLIAAVDEGLGVEEGTAALGNIGDDRAVAYLTALLEDRRGPVGLAARALGAALQRRSRRHLAADLLTRVVALDDKTANCSRARQLAREELARRDADENMPAEHADRAGRDE